MPTVLGTGLIALDVVIPSGPGSSAWCFLGGTCGNVLTILSALGWRSYPIGRLDLNHPACSLFNAELALWGLRTEFLHLAPPAAVPVIVQRNRANPDGGSRHSFSFRCPRCRRYLPGFQPVRLDTAQQQLVALPPRDVFFLDRPSPGNLLLAKEAAAGGALVVFEPTGIGKGPAERHFREAIALAHVLKYSNSRLPGFSDAPGSRSPLLEIETLGEAGLRYRRAIAGARSSDWVTLRALPAVVSGDTAGAGDWTTAIAIHVLNLSGCSQPGTLAACTNAEIEAALRAGQAAAAWNCQFQGARGSMFQSASVLSDFVQRLTGRLYPLDLRANGPLRAPEPHPVTDLMRKLCAVCRGYENVASATALPSTAPPVGGWRIVGRPGYIGQRRQSTAAELDRRYGVGRWRIAYDWQAEIITREQALEHYTRAYEIWLQNNSDLLDWLVRTASDIYDISPEDVQSNTDYNIQTGSAVHLQDIAVRIAVSRLGRKFEGDRLVQIRGRQSEGSALSPGVVPFHQPELITQPELKGWWQPGTVESFWQSNKVLQVRHPPRRTLMFGGSFNPVHNGHLALAKFVREQLGFDRVLFIPNGDNYRKPDLAPAVARLAMVQAAIAGEAAYDIVDVEVYSKEPLRVVKTTEELRAEYPEDDLVLLRGLDALPRTHHRLFAIPGLRVLVLYRDTGGRSFEEILRRNPHLDANRQRIDYIEEAFRCSLSSSEVRRALCEGRSIESLVPATVADIIRGQGLYNPAKTGTGLTDHPAHE
ncbi:MAG TPA: adenylyltransferase/cytidyltransferase family protein [Candidatus Paceibacterota bacterium]|nr:adenylyltransferase/cytidyltransferase family protein [Verrucomicrobiota bacterium]HSA10259.1 adenylyltransferase/cytidyltransferase family protein [Candidatus Paceibacterota bacterium]